MSGVCWLPQPGCLVFGTAQNQEEAQLLRLTLPGLPVAEKAAVSWPCSVYGLRHPGLGVLSQSQEMDLLARGWCGEEGR